MKRFISKTGSSIFFLLLVLSKSIFAYPTTIVHGYTSCTTCHFSPTGGGLLTPYGRSLSREVISTFGVEGEETAFYGIVSKPEVLHFGGDLRALQSYLNSAQMEQAMFTVMQADIEVGVGNDKVLGTASFGYQNSGSAHATKSPVLSRRHYIRVAIAENQYLRAGKFDGPYGFHFTEHFLYSRRDLGWDEGSETYQMEWSHIGEKGEVIASLSLGRPDAPELMLDKSASVTAAAYLGEKNRVGLGSYYGTGDRGDRLLIGPLASLSLLKNLTLFPELHYMRSFGGLLGEANGGLESLRLNYELFQGLHVYVIQEYEKLNFASASHKEAYTLGLNWFPRPHVELTGGFRKSKSAPMGTSFTDSAWLVLHYYL